MTVACETNRPQSLVNLLASFMLGFRRGSESGITTGSYPTEVCPDAGGTAIWSSSVTPRVIREVLALDAEPGATIQFGALTSSSTAAYSMRPLASELPQASYWNGEALAADSEREAPVLLAPRRRYVGTIKVRDRGRATPLIDGDDMGLSDDD